MTTPFKAQEPMATSKSRTSSLKRVFHCSRSCQSVRQESGRLSWFSLFAAMALFLGLSLPAISGEANAQDAGTEDSLARAVGWLVDQQDQDGGQPGGSGGSEPNTT